MTTTLETPATTSPPTTERRARAAQVAAALPVASVVAVDPWGLVPHGPLRWLVLAALVAVLVVVVRGGARVPRGMAVAWAGLLAALAAAAAAGLDPVHAWIGTPDRRLGWIAWAGFAVCWLAGGTLGRAVDRRVLGRGLAVAAVALAVGAGLDGMGLLPDDGVARRIGGTYGQPAYLGAMGVLALPVAWGVAVDAGEGRWWRLLGAVGALGTAAAVLASGTRGAWVGLLVAGVLVLAARSRVGVAAGAGSARSGERAPVGEGWVDPADAGSARSGERAPVGEGWVHPADAGSARPGERAPVGEGWVHPADAGSARPGEGAPVGGGSVHPPGLGRPHPGRRWRTAVVVGTALVVVGLLTPVGARALAAFDLTAGTAAGRLAEWEVAARVIAAHPVTGVGPEGYRIAFPAHVDVDHARTYGREAITDRAHNGLLDVTAAGGLPAGLAYAVLLAGVVVVATRAVRQGDPVLAGMGAAAAAYAAQQLFLFPLAEVDGVWWLLVGATGAAAARSAAVIPRPPGTAVVGALVLGAVVTAGSLGVVADHRMAAAARDAGPPTAEQAARAAAAATALRPDDVRLAFAAARITADGGRITDVDRALAHLDAGLAVSPGDPALRREQAALLAERARRSGLPDDVDRAIATHRDLIADDPTDPAPRIGLAHLLVQAGQPDAARTAVDAAAAIDPEADGLAAARALVAGPDLPVGGDGG